MKEKQNQKYYTIETMGCQMNEHDSEQIAFLLEEMGYKRTADKYKSDLILFNTCLIRENAELKLYGQIGALKQVKRENPNLILAVSGCMMQADEPREVILKKYPHVDVIFGTKNISKLPQLITRHLEMGERVIDVKDGDVIDEPVPYLRESSTNAYVNIVFGCDNFCSYCVVPYTRGREISRSPESIVEEVVELAKKGYKEITLLGQNVNSYGKNLETPTTFAALLHLLNDIEGLERIRFMTSHPKDFSEELIDAVASLDKVCKHIHLPLQSGSSRILKLMNRKYTKEHYLDLIDRIIARIPGVSLSTDIIVGFPTEKEEDFQETLDVVRKARFDQGFTFLYSRRKGTPADTMEDQVPDSVKRERFQRLLDEMYPIFHEKNKAYIGRVVEVLVEEQSKVEGILAGRTDTFKLCHFSGSDDLIGQIVRVKITGNNSFALRGELC